MAEGKRSGGTRQQYLQRAVARRSSEALAASIGLPHPATVPMPVELAGPLHTSPRSTSGRRVAKRKTSAYAASPTAYRIHQRGLSAEVVTKLEAARANVTAGGSIGDIIADATVSGWHARQALEAACGGPLLVWEEARGRTQAERLALVDRVLAELGAKRKHGGGWSVSR